MTGRRLGVALFLLGTFTVFVHTLFPFLWALVGIRTPYPLAAADGLLAYLPGFTPPLGALLMLFGGLVFGLKRER